MNRSSFLVGFLFLLLFGCTTLLATVAEAQSGGGQDSSQAGILRPRRGTYQVQAYPSPAKSGETITISFFCINPDVVSFVIYDMLNKVVMTLQEKGDAPSGLSTFQIPANKLMTGSYVARLTNYTPSGAENTVEDERFVVVK